MRFPSRSAAAAAVALSWSLAVATAAQTSPGRVRYEAGDFIAEGASAEADGVLQVFVQGAPPGSPAVSGDYSRRGGALVFRPRYPLQPGAAYRAVLRGQPAGSFVMPSRSASPRAFVERVYPTAAILPENQLKFYLHFSAPMSKGEAYRRIRLLEDGGAAVSLPFLELDEELWDREGRRFTLLFDPGRIKRGVLPREQAGGALAPGKRYTLVIDAAWQDAEGRPLREEFRKSFAVRDSDRVALDTAKWRIAVPASGTRDPLTADFGEPVDAALALRLIRAVDARGITVQGAAALDREESRWRFIPAEPWRPGRYALECASTLEDLAGNRIGRQFDVDRFERIDRGGEPPERVRLPFRVSAEPSRPAPAAPNPK